jgi:hypothetical protein
LWVADIVGATLVVALFVAQTNFPYRARASLAKIGGSEVQTFG